MKYFSNTNFYAEKVTCSHKTKFMTCLVILSFLIPVPIYSSKKGNVMSQSKKIMNAMLYSDKAQTSFISVSGNIQDDLLWITSFEKNRLTSSPVWIALFSNTVIAGSHNEIIAIDALNGKSLWKEQVILKFAFMCNTEGVLIDKSTKWRPYDSQELIIHLIGTPDNCFITDYNADKNYYWYGYRTTPMPVPRGENISYWFQFNRHVPEQELFVWSYRVEGTALGSLTTLDNKTFFVIMPNQIHHFPVDATSENAVTKFDVPFITSFALDHKGVLTLVVQDSGIYYLKQFSYSGEELWKVTLPGISQSKQPPASSPQGTIYYGESNSIVAVENSEVKWQLPLSKEPAFFYITVLADNSLLVASGNTLYAISEDGKIAKTVTIPFTITCRPIMGLDGAVYVGGSGGIACLK